LGAVTSRAAFITPADSAGPCAPHAVSGLEPGATSFDRPGAIPGIRRARIAAPYPFEVNSKETRPMRSRLKAVPAAPAFAQSGANQSASNSAGSLASNSSATTQTASAGCGGSGQAQGLGQNSSTTQSASSSASTNQNGVNANVPVSVSGGGVSVGNTHIGNSNPGGSSSASQSLDNSAGSSAANNAATNQNASQSQSSSSSCHVGCGGSVQGQGLQQNSSTDQSANSSAHANRNGVNANAPVSIGGGHVSGRNSAAGQDLTNSAESSASNDATTDQKASQSQDSSSSCHAGCGGSGQAQYASQDSSTHQGADSCAHADQNGVNANVPVSIGRGDVRGGNSSATQYNDNSASSEASNYAETNQDADQSQSSESSCHFGCGGFGQAQGPEQSSSTDQKADSDAHAYQNGVNANVAVTIGGDDVYGGDSSASQGLSNSAESVASNDATTNQYADQSQESSSECGAGCGGSGQAQWLGQSSDTYQDADSSAHADHNGVNANVPVSVGGDDVYGGESSADQYNDNSASSEASNYAETNQDADQSQSSESSCHFGCGGSGQAQWLEQSSSTDQKADSEAHADQNGVNTSAPLSIGGDDVDGGDSSASQELSSSAESSAYNDATTDQSQSASSWCWKGCGGSGQAQWLSQDSSTNQAASSKAKAKQHGPTSTLPPRSGVARRTARSAAPRRAVARRAMARRLTDREA
jgi:hypothetical protein